MKDKLVRLFWVFIIGCVIGFFWESIVCLFNKGYIENRSGLIYGPFTPVYGAGALLYMLAASKTKNIKHMFFITAFLGGLIEYLFSFFQEILFNTISWDYSDVFLNINGRTSVLHMIVWGMLGVIFLKLIYPYINKVLDSVPRKLLYVGTWIMFIAMLLNVFISTFAGIRQDERSKNIPPSNIFEKFIDKSYPDERMDKIFTNKKIIKK